MPADILTTEQNVNYNMENAFPIEQESKLIKFRSNTPSTYSKVRL